MTESGYKLKIFPTEESLNEAAADFIIATANKCVIERGRFSISLSGGATPRAVYALLAQFDYQQHMPWGKTFVFWGDERCVPLTDEQNNAYQAKLILLDKVDIPKSNVHPVHVNISPEQSAADYEKEIQFFFEDKPLEFDLILLGLGTNGHTASLFPGANVINEKEAGVRALFVEEEHIHRITMTASLINQAHTILFLVTGEKKAAILNQVLNDSYQPSKIPAQLIKPVHGDLYWFVDNAAASLISNS